MRCIYVVSSVTREDYRFIYTYRISENSYHLFADENKIILGLYVKIVPQQCFLRSQHRHWPKLYRLRSHQLNCMVVLQEKVAAGYSCSLYLLLYSSAKIAPSRKC